MLRMDLTKWAFMESYELKSRYLDNIRQQKDLHTTSIDAFKMPLRAFTYFIRQIHQTCWIGICFFHIWRLHIVSFFNSNVLEKTTRERFVTQKERLLCKN